MMLSSLDAVVFDLDGTLWNSCLSVQKAWNLGLDSWRVEHPLARENLSLKEVEGIMGLAFDEIFAKLFPEYSSEFQKTLGLYLEEFEKEGLAENGGDIYPGVNELSLEMVHQVPLGIVSNCQEGYIENFLNQAKELSLVGFKSHGHTGLPKHQNIADLCQENDWNKVVYLGDTLSDFKSCAWVNQETEICVKFHLATWGFGAQSVLDICPDQVRFSNFRNWWDHLCQ